VDRHALANRAGHTRKSDIELLRELLADAAHATIAKMIDIIDRSFTKLKPDDILQNLDNIFFR
jgi:hypothetical protein